MIWAGDQAADEQRSEYFTKDNWDLLNSNPDDHKGAKVGIVGKMFLENSKNYDIGDYGTLESWFTWR
jgi:hypothetical protein